LKVKHMKKYLFSGPFLCGALLSLFIFPGWCWAANSNMGDPVVVPQATVVPKAEPVKTGISKVTSTFYGDTAGTKGFTWYSPLTAAQSDLQIVKKTGSTPDFRQALRFSGRSAVATNSPAELVHKAEATGLTAASSYYFRVGDANLNLWSKVGTFRTASRNGAFTFIDLADTQAKSEEEAKLSAKTIAKAFQTVTDADFLAVNGDWVDTGSNEQQWDWLFGYSQTNLLNTTILPVAGNHEEQKNSFIDHFDLKPAPDCDITTGAYYSVNYNNTHFIVINNNEDSPEYANFTLTQLQWLQADVEAAKAGGATWLIVLMHKGPYTTSNHATDADIIGPKGVRTKVAPLFAELGIDLVLQGHDHIYARSKPIRDGVAFQTTKLTKAWDGNQIDYAINPDGPIYVIPNTAGPKVYYKNKKLGADFYDLFEVADEHHAAVYGPDPGDAGRPVRSQIQNFMGITIDGDKLTAVVYEIDQRKDKAKPYVIDRFGILKR
jgi:predicted phosphodiesterase